MQRGASIGDKVMGKELFGCWFHVLLVDDRFECWRGTILLVVRHVRT